MQSLKKMMLFFIATSFCFCNKNSDQLPFLEPPAKALIIPAAINGLAAFEFNFEQHTTDGEESVRLKIKNLTSDPVQNLHYLVEICKEPVQNFKSCNLQSSGILSEELPPGEETLVIQEWSNQKINLQASTINVGIISYDQMPAHPFAGVFENQYALFELSNNQSGYYGRVRGYVLVDGTARFRLEGRNNEYLNLRGFFALDRALEGVLESEENIVSSFGLDSVEVDGQKSLVNTEDNNFIFRMALREPLKDNTQSILAYTKRKP